LAIARHHNLTAATDGENGGAMPTGGFVFGHFALHLISFIWKGAALRASGWLAGPGKSA
jgi:hypothetical protein